MGRKYEKKGTALLPAVCMGRTASIGINASPKIRSKSVKLNVAKVTVCKGDIVTLDAVMNPTNSTDTVSWSSSKKGVADVNRYGVVTAVGEGTATVTAKTSSRKKAKCAVTVKDCLTEEAAKELIRENALSGEGAGKLVADTAGSGSGDAWEDGTGLSAFSDKQLPMTKNGRTVTEISIKKYRFDGEWDGRPQKYKYVLEIKGTRDLEMCDESMYEDIHIQFTRKDGMAEDGRYYDFPCENGQNEEDGDLNASYSENGGEFAYTAEQYNMYVDYDEYIILYMGRYYKVP